MAPFLDDAEFDLPDGGILRYYLFRVTRSANFAVPIFVLFFLSRGLSLAQVGLLEGLFMVGKLAAETPTGYVGDRIGRRNSTIVGTFLSAVGAVSFIFVHSFIWFAVLMVVRSIGSAFRSGSIDAWLYDKLLVDDDEEQYAHVRGRGDMLGLFSHGLAAVTGGVLYTWNHAYPWVFEGVVVGSGILVLLTVSESGSPQTDEDGDEPLGVDGAIEGVKNLVTQDSTRLFVLYTSLFFAVGGTVTMFIQPISVDVIGIPATYIGTIYFALTVVGALSASKTGYVKDNVGIKRWFMLVPPAYGVGLVAVLFAPVLALPLFLASGATGSISKALAGQYINDRIPSEGRATTLSAWSMVRSLFTAPANWVGGAIATVVLLPKTFAILGIFVLACFGATMLSNWPVTTETPKPVSE